MKVRLPDKDTTGIDNTRTDYIELRDYIAIKAMQGMVSHYGDDGDSVGEIAYRMADAMLEARKQ